MKESIKKILCIVQPIAVSLIFILLLLTIRNNPVTDLSKIDGGIILLILFIAAYVLESKYLSTTWVLPSTLILYVLLQNSKDATPFLLDLYLYAGIILVLSAYLLCHLKKIKGNMYKATFVLYSLKTILPLYLSYYLLGSYNHPYLIYAFILFSIISWAFYLEAGM